MSRPKHAARLTALALLKAIGGFTIARRLTRKGIRIVCYHGFSLRDEHEFRPGMWIRPATLERRLAYLRGEGYTVLPLGEALERQRDGTLPAATVVLTIDDGFYGTLAVALPILQRYDMPATLYLTTYYVMTQDPVFDLAAAYVLSRTRRDSLDLSALGMPSLQQPLPWGRLSREERTAVTLDIVAHAHGTLSRSGRARALEQLAEAADVPLQPVLEGRLFSLLTRDEVARLHQSGVAVEIHTHRHRTPTSADEAARELTQNAQLIEGMTGRVPRHFCYPSGDAEGWQDAWLAAAGVPSATTCRPGLVYPDTCKYHLGRFNDGECVAQLMFEAEMSGVLELWRRLRARLSVRTRAPAAASPAAATAGGGCQPALGALSPATPKPEKRPTPTGAAASS